MKTMNRRQFVGHLGNGAAAVALLGSSSLLAGCTAASDVSKVLALLPTVEAIANSVANVIVAVDPAIGVAVKAALAIITTGFSTVQAIITAYQSNIAGMPASVLNELDAAVAAIESQMTAIEAQFPQLPAAVVAGINVGLIAFQTILGLVASLVPAPVASARFPKSYARLSSRGIQFGVSVSVIPTPREFAQQYNAKMDTAGFHQAHIHVPWKWHVIP